MPLTLNDLRRFAIARSLFAPTTLKRALEKLQYVQADPIRAPARAQDLTLRHRVKDYRAGDLDRRYTKLGVAEDIFISYGFVTRELQALMHPREHPWPADHARQARMLLDYIRERGEVHPADVDSHFSFGKVTNYWGGSSKATTHLMEAMHYRGLLRVVRREGGVRIYAAHQHEAILNSAVEQRARIDRLVDVAVRVYAPIPASRLSTLISRLRYAVPQWRGELRAAFQRAKQRLPHARVDGVDWYWPEGENPARGATQDLVRLLAPFDPVVWDRDRFEMLWGWTYRFEAYTPAPKRLLGYYALPLAWRDRVIGWGNLAVKEGVLEAEIGYVEARPRDAAFKRELSSELDRMRFFLGCENSTIR